MVIVHLVAAGVRPETAIAGVERITRYKFATVFAAGAHRQSQILRENQLLRVIEPEGSRSEAAELFRPGSGR